MPTLKDEQIRPQQFSRSAKAKRLHLDIVVGIPELDPCCPDLIFPGDQFRRMHWVDLALKFTIEGTIA